MASSSLTIRIDEKVKAEFIEVCDEMGIPATTALTIFVRKVIRDRAIPFQLVADTKPADSDVASNATNTIFLRPKGG